MSRHAIDRAGWSPEEREEYEVLLAEIVDATKDSRERIDLLEHRLLDAVQAHRPWANEVDRACRRQGLGQEIRRFEDRRNTAFVSHDGALLSVPATQSRRVSTPDGEVYQRELIQVWTWEEIEVKRVEAIRTRRTYDAHIEHYDRLLALRVRCPGSATPADAAKRLGIDLDVYLAAKAA